MAKFTIFLVACLILGCAPGPAALPASTAVGPGSSGAPGASVGAEGPASASTEPAREQASMPMPERAGRLLERLETLGGAAFIEGTNVRVVNCDGFRSSQPGSAEIGFQGGALVLAVTSAMTTDTELLGIIKAEGYRPLGDSVPGPELHISRTGEGPQTLSRYLVALRARHEWALVQASFVGEPTQELDEAIAVYLSAPVIDSWRPVFVPGPEWQLDPGPWTVLTHREGKWVYGKDLTGDVTAVVARHTGEADGAAALKKRCAESPFRPITMGPFSGCSKLVPADPKKDNDHGLLALRLRGEGPPIDINVLAKGASQANLSALRKQVQTWLKSYGNTSHRIDTVHALGLVDYDSHAGPSGIIIEPDGALWLRRDDLAGGKVGAVLRVLSAGGDELLRHEVLGRNEVYVADLAGDGIREIVVRMVGGNSPRALPAHWDIYQVEEGKLARIAQIADSNTSDVEGTALGDPRVHFRNQVSMPRRGLLLVETIEFWEKGPNPPPGAPRRVGQLYELRHDAKRGSFVTKWRKR